MSRCWVRTKAGKRCKDAATQEVTAGCVHEHITVNVACDRCTKGLLDGSIKCARCWHGTRPHDCPLLIRATPLQPVGPS